MPGGALRDKQTGGLGSSQTPISRIEPTQQGISKAYQPTQTQSSPFSNPSRPTLALTRA